MDLYPHDPAYRRWLFGRRRCSTVLEVEEKSSREGSFVMEERSMGSRTPQPPNPISTTTS